ARLALNRRFTTATACVEVMPIGLSSTTQPWTSRRSRLTCCCLFARGALLVRRGPPGGSGKIFSVAPRRCAFCASRVPFAVVTLILLRPVRVRGLAAPQVFAVISRSVPLHRIVHRRGIECQVQISG